MDDKWPLFSFILWALNVARGHIFGSHGLWAFLTFENFYVNIKIFKFTLQYKR
jgi:hypothetical protein